MDADLWSKETKKIYFEHGICKYFDRACFAGSIVIAWKGYRWRNHDFSDNSASIDFHALHHRFEKRANCRRHNRLVGLYSLPLRIQKTTRFPTLMGPAATGRRRRPRRAERINATCCRRMVSQRIAVRDVSGEHMRIMRNGDFTIFRIAFSHARATIFPDNPDCARTLSANVIAFLRVSRNL